MSGDGVWRARLYERVHTGSEGDVPFYLRVCQGARHVLELGCGTGRVLGPLAASGLEVTGVDLDADKLALLRTRLGDEGAGKVTLLAADMQAVDIAARFDRVIIPYNGLYTLPTDAAMVACLHRARTFTVPGALLYLDVYAVDPPLAGLPRVAGPTFAPLARVVGDGWEAEVQHRQEEMEVARSFRVHYRYELQEVGVSRSRLLHDAITHHYLRDGDLERVLVSAGWRLDALWGDFQRGHFDAAESAHMVVRAVRAG